MTNIRESVSELDRAMERLSGKDEIQVFVEGDPKAQPRPRAVSRGGGRARVYNPSTAKGWKSQIAVAVYGCRPKSPWEGPVRVELVFSFRRPKSHYRTGKFAGQLKDLAPVYHTQKPDRDNLEKAVLDTLTELGVIKDDSQVCDGSVVKLWASKRPGLLLRIQRMVDLPLENVG